MIEEGFEVFIGLTDTKFLHSVHIEALVVQIYTKYESYTNFYSF